jgi:hypothetical protein
VQISQHDHGHASLPIGIPGLLEDEERWYSLLHQTDVFNRVACGQMAKPDRDRHRAKICLTMYSIAFFVDRGGFSRLLAS